MVYSFAALALSLAAIGATFSGRVVDSRTGEPVPAADVRIQPGDFTAVTDSTGTFAVTGALLPAEATVFVSRIGYAARAFYNVPTAKMAVLTLQRLTLPMEGTCITMSRVRLQDTRPTSRSLPYAILEGFETETRGRPDISAGIALTPSASTQDYGNLTTVSLRGATPEQTLVMLDGVPLNSGLNGLSDITLLPVLPESRIELVRGGSSAIYGANSVGGVLNLITPVANDSRLQGVFGIGSFGQKHGSLSCQLPAEPVGLYLASGLLHARNNFPYRDRLDSLRLRQNSDITRWNATTKISNSRRSRHHYSLLGDFVLSRRGTPGPLSWPTDSARQNDTRLLGLLEYGWEQKSSAGLTARLYHQWHWQNYSNPAGYCPANDTHTIARTGLELTENLLVGDRLGMAGGLQSAYEQALSTAVGEPERLDGTAWYEARWQVASLTLYPALRWDISSHTGHTGQTRNSLSALSPRFTLVWSPVSFLNLSFGANRSFRQPTFNELYWPVSQFTAGNPALKPEHSTGLDLGLGGTLSAENRLTWRLGTFVSRLTDLIQWQQGVGDTWRPVNIDTATTAGIETELETEFNLVPTRAGLNYSATYMVCRSRGADLPYRPRLTGHVSFWLSLIQNRTEPGRQNHSDCIRLVITARGSSRRFGDAANQDTLPGYLLFDAEAALAPPVGRNNLSVRAGCRNVLDHRYETARGYPVPGRSLYAEIELSYSGNLLAPRRPD